jgi:acetyl-CoA carboxylase biotin carboxyl carrier protein
LLTYAPARAYERFPTPVPGVAYFGLLICNSLAVFPNPIQTAEPMKQIPSMMAGVVVELLVKPGDTVSDGMDVAILESMKMQLPVQSNTAGTVKDIKVAAGDFVNEGDPLMDLE